MRKVTSLSLVGALLFGTVATTGCFGKFALTRKVYGWNDSLGNKFVKTLVMWAMFIIPVYELVGAGDFLIFNLIEFWGGSNPVGAATPTQTRMLADGSVEVRRGDEVFLLVPTGPDRFDLLHGQERVGMGVATADGGLRFTVIDSGRSVELSGQDVAQLRVARAAR